MTSQENLGVERRLVKNHFQRSTHQFVKVVQE